MGKKLIIIGAGMGGMAAGIHGRRNGFETTIFEQHSLPGGQCTGYKRQGYTFDVCIHHFMGANRTSAINRVWQELDALTMPLIKLQECTAVADSHGNSFIDYYDPLRLRAHLQQLAPADQKAINAYLRGQRRFSKIDLMGPFLFGSRWRKFCHVLRMLPLMPYMFTTLEKFGKRFSNPFLRRAWGKLVYSLPDVPLGVHLARKADGFRESIRWPEGGALALARSLADSYQALGGELVYRAAVEKILVEAGRAVGVRLADGSEYRADYVISNADGRKTILNMLDGKFSNKTLQRWCRPNDPDEPTNWSVHVMLGLNRDLSHEPCARVLLLDQPVRIAGYEHDSLELEFYGHDPTMAPPGKSALKVELWSTWNYWKDLFTDEAAYKNEKETITEQVLHILEKFYPGIRGQVEVVDVPTLRTWERYMGGSMGFNCMPNKPFDFVGSITGKGVATLPGLKNFYMTGTWATQAGALFMNALSGRRAIEAVCRQERRRFRSS